MAVPKKNLVHSDGVARKLAFDVGSKVDQKTLRADDRGDALVKNVCKGYDKMEAAFKKLVAYYDKALNSKGVASAKVKSELTEAKKKAKSRVSACETRRNEVKRLYNQSYDIYNSVEK